MDIVREGFAEQKRKIVQEMMSYGCPTRMHIVRLLAPSLAYEDQTKDVDFSARGIRTRWQAGYEHTSRALEAAPWTEECEGLDSVVLHEMHAGEPVEGNLAAGLATVMSPR